MRQGDGPGKTRMTLLEMRTAPQKKFRTNFVAKKMKMQKKEKWTVRPDLPLSQ